MDHKTKMMLVDALTDVVKNSPTKSVNTYSYGTPYTSGFPYNVTKEQLDIWLKYIYGVLQITSQYVDVNSCLFQIQQINMELNMPPVNKVIKISEVLLDFARKILYM